MKVKFKTDHLKDMDFNTKAIKRKFAKVRRENKKILASSVPDLTKLNERYF